MKVIVAGAGPGAKEYFSQAFVQEVLNADLVLTSKRLAGELKMLNDNVNIMGVGETVGYINENADKEWNILVAASGDTGFYSIANTIRRQVLTDVRVEYICGLGSLSYFASKIKTSYENMKLVSLHGVNASIVPFVTYNKSVFALTGGLIKAGDIVRQLIDADLGDVMVNVGVNLSLEDEKIIRGKAKELVSLHVDDLAVVIIENENPIDSYITLKDEDFVRGKSPMTKEAVRNLSMATLEIHPRDVVYDVGAGTGSLTCAMALKANESMVYAVEKEEAAVKLVKENINNLGTRNIEIVWGNAPEAMEKFPAPDKVFIGGSKGNLREIVEFSLGKNHKAVFVVTAVSIETLTEAVQLFKNLNFDTEISMVNHACAKKIANYNLMMGENPVYIIKGAKNFEK